MDMRIRHLSLRMWVVTLLGLVVTITFSVTLFWLTAQPIAGQTSFTLRVMKMGLGSGTVASSIPGITCGGDCDETYGSGASVTLMASAADRSTFARWEGDCLPAGTTSTCTVTVSAALSVRAVFSLTSAIAPIINPAMDTDINRTAAFTPTAISTYLSTNTTVTSTARFIAALPRDFKQNWILMSRSESLQTGTAESPRILLPSADAKYVFTVGMTRHASYPGSHPNAIEYMQWDAAQKNFRFHEIVLDTIPQMGAIITRTRGVSIDDAKCSRCHSTRNILSLDRSVFPPITGVFTGTDGISPGSVQVKNKPNWDAYDSWSGMLPFNRDRIYQGSVEAAAFRKIFNPWSWQTNDAVRQIIEQLELQPPGIPATDAITQTNGGPYDGHVNFAFDPPGPVLLEPPPDVTLPVVRTNYFFNGVAGTGPETVVRRGGRYVTLRHITNLTGSDEGRGVRFFDLLGGARGDLNQLRIADELINHRYATGSIPIDVRPITLAITKQCLRVNAAANTVTPLLTGGLSFFNSRHGITGINELVNDTRLRAERLTQRKADLQKLTLDRQADPYLLLSDPADGLIQQYGGATSLGTDISLNIIDITRQEVFRRPTTTGACPSIFCPDSTVIGGIYVDREDYTVDTVFNTEMIALYRYFLEPLGVSVDKWSMGVRGRSRTYTFADVFDDLNSYRDVLQRELEASLAGDPRGLTLPNYECAALINAVNNTLSSLPATTAAPTYTDIQRIFNKSCIECHGGLGYPPYRVTGTFDLSENEFPAVGQTRLTRSHSLVENMMNRDPTTSYFYQRITAADTNAPCSATDALQLMPCGGPPLSQADIKTIARWIIGESPDTIGDPHIKTIDGVNYDFQSAGEFVLLRGEGTEIQVRQRAVETKIPLDPHPHSGLSTCASVNAAVALRVGPHRITYQPNLSGQPDPSGLQLRIDGKLTPLDNGEILLPAGGRIVRTTIPGGIQVEYPGGSLVAITPLLWDYYQVWHLNITMRHIRATEGLMGTIAPGNWLPALPDGTLLGPRPNEIHPRYVALYETFADAWRVSDATTLFDYAPGTSTATFTIDRWPTDAGAQEIPSCTVPEQASSKPPLEPLPLAVATQHCSAIIGEERRANCIQDVMVTGEPGFAKAYLLTQQVESNGIPTAPPLALPANNQTIVADKDGPIPVSFQWNNAIDSDNDALVYKYCLWEIDEMFTYTKCRAVSSQTLSLDVVLEPGKAYFWKIIAEDGKGSSTESETRRLTTTAVNVVQHRLFMPFVVR